LVISKTAIESGPEKNYGLSDMAFCSNCSICSSPKSF